MHRYLIAIPCMDMVHTFFMASLMAMHRPDNTELSVSSSSLIYDSCNSLAAKAVNEGFDRVLWLDSDMVFEPDLMERLIADLDEGRQFVSGMYYTRKAPINPCVYKALNESTEGTEAVVYEDYPKDTVFEVAGCGFGAVMMDTEVLRKAGQYGIPFSPIEGGGEDFSFELRAREAGVKLYCDSRIQVGHIGLTVINGKTARR